MRKWVNKVNLSSFQIPVCVYLPTYSKTDVVSLAVIFVSSRNAPPQQNSCSYSNHIPFQFEPITAMVLFSGTVSCQIILSHTVQYIWCQVVSQKASFLQKEELIIYACTNFVFSLISAIFKQRVLHFSWVSYFIIGEENFLSQGVGRILDSYANPWLALHSPTPSHVYIMQRKQLENIFHCLNVDRSVITKVWEPGISWLLWKGA